MSDPEWWERAVSGMCSHGGHGYDGEACSDERDVTRYAGLIMAEIDADIAAGIVPATVSSFGELHDYVDANGYADAAGVPQLDPPDEPWALVNLVETEVCRRLAERAGAAECDACRRNREASQPANGK